MKNFFTRKGVRVVLGIFIVFLLLVLSRVPVVLKKEKSQETVGFIESVRLTMQDVDGSNLPPKPSPDEVDKTIEGVDVNKNYIRDDVELAIFEMYPDEENIKLRAASLQYAMALQLYLTHVFSEETWIAAAKQNSRGVGCLYRALPRVTLEDGKEAVDRFSKEIDSIEEGIYNLVLNTEKRNVHNTYLYESYTASNDGYEGNACDLDM